MRRVLLLLLTVFLASGTIAVSIAHAIEERAEISLPAVMLDSGCLSASIADVAEPEKQSSRDDQKQTPTAPHGCHGHHSGVPAETLAAASEVPFAQSHARMMAAALPPVAYIGTFRPPIA